MAFWGIEIKPGKPYIHRYEDENGRLHVSQATLGAGSSSKESIILQCQVGDKTPIYLCSLLPEKLPTSALNLEFEEEKEVTFSVIGSRSVHLSGFFLGEIEDDDEEDDYNMNPYEEDVMVTDSDDDVSYDSEDDDGEDFDDDDDLEMFPSSHVPNSGVKIEEIVDDEKAISEAEKSKRGKRKKTQSSVPNDEKSNRQMVVKGKTDTSVLESEDEDGFPVSAREGKSDISKSGSKLEEPKENVGDKSEKKKLKRKIDAVSQDGEPASGTKEPQEPSAQPENDSKKKKNKNKKKKVSEKEESAQKSELTNSNTVEQIPEANAKTTSEKKKEKKKQNKQGESATNADGDKKVTDKKGSIVEKEEKKEAKSLQLRSFPNGLVIEELKMGKPDAKGASPGKKVSVHYIGKLKKNGKIFDSNIGRAPFKFRLGIGQVIKGWDVGVNGMRVGDKRRITIPPAMGYGAKGCGPDIPPNSWLVFDVDLVDVN